MNTRIDESSPVPLYHQIAEAIRWKIANGEIRPLQELPPARKAAATWKVHRHTVRRAYRLLFDEGVLEKTRPPVRMQARPSHTNKVRAGAKRRRPKPGRNLSHFVERICLEARMTYGLDAPGLAAVISKRTEMPERETITVLECNSIQSEDLADQLSARWDIEASPAVLTDVLELPKGRIVSTLFHYSEIHQRWPDRMGDFRFLALRPDPNMRRMVDKATTSAKPRVLVLGDRNIGEAQNLAADLKSVFPEVSYRVSAATFEAWTAAGEKVRRGEVVLVAPRAWPKHAMPERKNVLTIRYVFDPHDLDAVGAALGIEPAQKTTA